MFDGQVDLTASLLEYRMHSLGVILTHLLGGGFSIAHVSILILSCNRFRLFPHQNLTLNSSPKNKVWVTNFGGRNARVLALVRAQSGGSSSVPKQCHLHHQHTRRHPPPPLHDDRKASLTGSTPFFEHVQLTEHLLESLLLRIWEPERDRVETAKHHTNGERSS